MSEDCILPETRQRFQNLCDEKYAGNITQVQFNELLDQLIWDQAEGPVNNDFGGPSAQAQLPSPTLSG